MKFNINNLVKVKLSEYGKEIIRYRYAECGIKDYEVKIDNRGYTEF